MGVWIETRTCENNTNVHEVTPCMGVWIETNFLSSNSSGLLSHTLYGCVD